MTAGTLPLEILNRIVQQLRPVDLPPLCRVNKMFQRVTERKLYNNLILGDVNLAYRVYMSLIAHDGMRGPYVKRLWFYIDPRRGVTRGHLAHQFWQMMQVALSTMTELKDLLIHDPAGTATWILDPDEMRFQLHTAKFRLQWDDDMVAFLQSQHQLKHLQTLDAHDITRVVPLPEGHLRELEAFEGPLLVAAEMLSCPSLSHLRVIVDEEVFQLLPQFVENIVTSDPPLRSLHVNVIPDPVVEETLEALTVDPKCCARIQHLGVIMMPWIHRHVIHRHLTRLHNLQSIAFEVSHLDPAPIEGFQRAIALEMNMYCPSLRRVSFWFGHHQVVLWAYRQDTWTCAGVHPHASIEDQLWLSV
ncbi:hypothetical protein BXZ70DRAFT_1002581 [Cristinia sonorae]|uniref:F-box domain-containing protein n=1 Tax=Cristinia sonorae TaxID=1940300 RepID=A0A8K0UEJ0_9AGAR|nr:hypothetical protein BXZ70DRAFT_1002581 [Cristinia sonorae]